VVVAHLDHVTLVERARDAGDAGGQQRSAALDQRSAGTIVDADHAFDLTGEADPQLACRQAAFTRLKRGTDELACGGLDQHIGLIRRRDHRTRARP